MIDPIHLGEQVGSASVWGVVAGLVLRLLKLVSGRG